MNITELINKLKELRSSVGDIDVGYPVSGHDMGNYYNNVKEVVYVKDDYFHRYIIALK